MPPRVTGDKVLLLSESAMIPAPVSLVVVNRIGVSAPVRSLACSVLQNDRSQSESLS